MKRCREVVVNGELRARIVRAECRSCGWQGPARGGPAADAHDRAVQDRTDHLNGVAA